MSTVTTRKLKTQTAPITWEEGFDLFETFLRSRRSSERTIALYMPDLAFLARLLPDKQPNEVTVEELRELQCGLMSGTKSRSKRPLAPASVSRITAAWRSFFRFLAEEERIEKDPGARLDGPRVPKRLPLDALTVREVTRLLNTPSAFTPKGLRDRALLDLLYSAGLRRAELLALDLTDVDHHEREVRVMGKGEKGRVVPLTRSAYARLTDYLDRARPVLAAKSKVPTEALFLTVRGTRLDGDALRWLLPIARAKAGIKKRVTPHALRRTFATTLLKNGVNVRHIQELLGHASLATTAYYLRIDRSELRRELLLRHPRERMDA